MLQTIKILIAEADLEKRIGLKKLLFQVPTDVKSILRNKEVEIVGEAESVKEVEILAAKLSPEIILMSSNIEGVNAVCRIAYAFPSSSIIIISDHFLTQDEFKKSMLAGIRSFLVQPIDQLELHKVIIELFEINNQKRERLETTILSTPVTRSKIIAMFGATGGVGRTLLSTNLAVFMAKYLNATNKKVALLDLDLQFGDIAIMLNLTP